MRAVGLHADVVVAISRAYRTTCTLVRSGHTQSASRSGTGGGPPTEIVADPHAALARARELAGPDGAVIATGSIYLVADLLSAPGARRASAL